MRSIFVAPILAIFSLVPYVAAAQRDTSGMGFRLNQEIRDHRRVEATTPPQKVMQMTAKCLVKNHSATVTSYLETIPASSEENRAYAKLDKSVAKCMPNMAFENTGNMTNARGRLSMSFDHSALRGGLAEAVMRQDRMSINLERIALGDAGMFVAAQYHGGRSAEASRDFALGFAGCVMGHNPKSLAPLFETEPASPAERSAIVSMASSFAECVMEGQTLTLDAPTLRNQLAEVTYYAMQNEAS